MNTNLNETIIYIDESGDLGFNLDHKGTWKYLILTALVCDSFHTSQKIIHAIKKVRYHENKRNKKALLSELKGSKTKLDLKRYFFKQLNTVKGWQLFSIIKNKNDQNNLYKDAISHNQFYNQSIIKLLQNIPFQNHNTLIIDRSKNPKEIQRLNILIEDHFKNSSTFFTIKHDHSYIHAGLQAVDIFAWGIARKYEYNDINWYQIFKERITLELEA